MAKILATAAVRPPYEYTSSEILDVADKLWFGELNPALRRMAMKIFEGAQIDKRSSVIPLSMVFSNLSFEEKNDLYKNAVLELGEQALSKAIKLAGIRLEELDYIITTSCTGFMIPSMDAYLVNRLGLRQDIIRLPVTEMGCAGGTSGLIYAHQFLKHSPHRKLALVSVETPSVTFQKNDHSMENFVSTAIFADGASAVIIGDSSKMAPTIIDTQMYHFPDSTHLMGYELKNSGLKIVLDKDVPDTIQQHFPRIFFPLLDRNRLQPEDIQHYMFHPGGKKIISMVDKFISQYSKDISDSKWVLQNHGNMSSSTILFILERFLHKGAQEGDKGYMLAFGPGFAAQSLLLEWV